MNNASPLLRPILAEVDIDGRLLRADESLARLNQRAGGVEGGMLAVPALAHLARLSLQLKMQLSRRVQVADNDELLELWVEVRPEQSLAKLAIIGWQAASSLAKPRADAVEEPQSPNAGSIKFDQAGRLVKATGIASQGLSHSDFGADGVSTLTALFLENAGRAELLDALATRTPTDGIVVTRQFDGTDFRVECRLDDTIFVVQLEALPARTPLDVAVSSGPGPEAMFGKHLAPVLRQPLGRIIANAETIGSELQGPIRENYALYARDIANAARHLSALVDDLGDLEAVERADFRTEPDHIELGDVARRVAGLLSLKAADHRIRLLTPPEDEKIPAIAEFRRTLQILLNLVNNAIRYSPDGTDVSIQIAKNDEFATISVSDQGSGIDQADREKIFAKFERLGRSGDGGSGLGLYISRRLARAMGGELAVSEAPTGGAKFTLSLPAADSRTMDRDD